MAWHYQPDPNYLAALLASTAPPPPRSATNHATIKYPQHGLPPDYAIANIPEQPHQARPRGNVNFQGQQTQMAQPMLFHHGNMLHAQVFHNSSIPSCNQPGQHPSITHLGNGDEHPPQLPVHSQPRRPIGRGQEHHAQERPFLGGSEAESGVVEELEQEEADEGSTRRASRRMRKTRKIAPILVFDNDSDDGDYQENRGSKKRKKYTYDSEGAIDADNAIDANDANDAKSSSEEEANKPAVAEKAEVSQTKPKKVPYSRRKKTNKEIRTPKSKTTDAKVKAENASLLLNRKGKGRPIPRSVEECDEADLMMWQWKNSGRNWKDIREEWIRIMGVKPGRSSLSVRLAKMQDNFIDSGAGNDLMILKYKEEVEAELEEIKWQKVAQKIKEDRDIDMKPATIKKRFTELQANGWVVDAQAEGKAGRVDGSMGEDEDFDDADQSEEADSDEESVHNNAKEANTMV